MHKKYIPYPPVILLISVLSCMFCFIGIILFMMISMKEFILDAFYSVPYAGVIIGCAICCGIAIPTTLTIRLFLSSVRIKELMLLKNNEKFSLKNTISNLYFIPYNKSYTSGQTDSGNMMSRHDISEWMTSRINDHTSFLNALSYLIILSGCIVSVVEYSQRASLHASEISLVFLYSAIIGGIGTITVVMYRTLSAYAHVSFRNWFLNLVVYNHEETTPNGITASSYSITDNNPIYLFALIEKQIEQLNILSRAIRKDHVHQQRVADELSDFVPSLDLFSQKLNIISSSIDRFVSALEIENSYRCESTCPTTTIDSETKHHIRNIDYLLMRVLEENAVGRANIENILTQHNNDNNQESTNQTNHTPLDSGKLAI